MKNNHILFIIENRAVPFDKRVWLSAKVAKERGYNVSIISRKEKLATLAYENLEGIDIYRHSVPVDAEGKFAYLFEYGYALFWETVLAIKIYIRKPFQIIHAGNPPDTIFFLALLFKLLGVKYIFDIHDLSPELYLIRFSGRKNILYKMLTLAEKLSCKLADVIITTNMSYRRIVADRHGIDPRKIFIVRNDPVNSEYSTKVRKKISNNGDKKVLLYLGSINPQDGVDILLQILDCLVNDFNEKNFICYIVGDGHSLPVMKQTAKKLDLGQYVNFTGYIYNRKTIKDYLELADVCIEPAPDNELNRHSTFIKIMEYMMARKPLVAFDLIETRHSAGESAIFVRPGDIKGFARAIAKLLEDQQLREELGEIGYDKIKNELNWENASLNLIEAYDSLPL